MSETDVPADQDEQLWWRRILSAWSLVDVVAGAVSGWTPLPASEAAWLTQTPLPTGWQTVRIVENAPAPLRVAAVLAEGHSSWTGCQALSAFRFTGDPALDLLSDNADRSLRESGAIGIWTDVLVLPLWPGVAGVRTAGYPTLDGRMLWVEYTAYLRGSAEPGQGLLVEQIIATNAVAMLRLGKDIGALSGATKAAFLVHIGATADDMDTAVAAHVARMRAEAARGPVLSDPQRRFLWHALAMWGSVASYRPLPIQMLGYADWAEFDADIERLRAQLSHPEPAMSDVDWTRVLLLAEISFGSDLLGAGVEFELVNAWKDPEALSLLRSIQRVLGRTVDAKLLFPGAGRPRPAPLDKT